jgi:hypothetical protein
MTLTYLVPVKWSNLSHLASYAIFLYFVCRAYYQMFKWSQQMRRLFVSMYHYHLNICFGNQVTIFRSVHQKSHACEFWCTPPEDGNLVAEINVGVIIIHTYILAKGLCVCWFNLNTIWPYLPKSLTSHFKETSPQNSVSIWTSPFSFRQKCPAYCSSVIRDSILDIATRYELDIPGIESRWQRDFSAPIQTSRGAHPAS